MSGELNINRRARAAPKQAAEKVDPNTPRLPPKGPPSYPKDGEAKPSMQSPTDEVDEASMESFPASDPPGYYPSHV